MNGGRPHEHTEKRSANSAESANAVPSAPGPLNEMQRRQEALEREIEVLKGERLENDSDHKH